MRVLIADDNDQNLYLLEAILRGNGHHVVSAHDGNEALARLKAEGADLIISDILMPEMDGFQFCRAVRSDDTLKHIPFIFYSATYTDTKDIEFGLSLGADRYLIKPQEPEVLFQAVTDLMAERTAPAEDVSRPLGKEMEFFRQYNDVLFRKLEKKISDLELANQALKESEHRTKAILNNIPDMAWLKDIKSRYLAVNKPFSSACGLSREELLGKTDLDIWPEELAVLYRKDDVEVMQSRLSKRIEERLVDNKGKELLIETIKSPVFDSDGAVIGTTGIARDITERRRAEEERSQLEEQLRQAQKMEAIGQLAGGVAHDFNNMLTAIIGFASLSLMKMASDDPNRLNIDQILAAANKAAVLTQSLLTFGRKQVISLSRVDLNELLRRFEKFLLRVLREDIELKCNCADGELPVMADCGQLEQVLMNLMTNARDAMPKGGRIIIETSLVECDRTFVDTHGFGEAGKYVLLSVSDTGSGMDEAVRRKIFEPFFTTKAEGKGTGLGLAMVYGIVRQHKGAIDVYSKPGMGTTFKIYIPLDLGPAEGKTCDDEEQAPLRGGSETILLAEDDAVIRKLTATVLEEYGYKVIEAVDGQDAIARAIENLGKINLVLLDGIMPNMNGKKAWLEIKALNPGIKGVFMSGYAEDVFTKEGIPEGDACFIRKPVSPSVLIRKIRLVLDA